MVVHIFVLGYINNDSTTSGLYKCTYSSSAATTYTKVERIDAEGNASSSSSIEVLAAGYIYRPSTGSTSWSFRKASSSYGVADYGGGYLRDNLSVSVTTSEDGNILYATLSSSQNDEKVKVYSILCNSRDSCNYDIDEIDAWTRHNNTGTYWFGGAPIQTSVANSNGGYDYLYNKVKILPFCQEDRNNDTWQVTTSCLLSFSVLIMGTVFKLPTYTYSINVTHTSETGYNTLKLSANGYTYTISNDITITGTTTASTLVVTASYSSTETCPLYSINGNYIFSNESKSFTFAPSNGTISGTLSISNLKDEDIQDNMKLTVEDHTLRLTAIRFINSAGLTVGTWSNGSDGTVYFYGNVSDGEMLTLENANGVVSNEVFQPSYINYSKCGSAYITYVYNNTTI